MDWRNKAVLAAESLRRAEKEIKEILDIDNETELNTAERISIKFLCEVTGHGASYFESVARGD